MLMITCSESNGAGRILKLEGTLRQPWLDELRKLCNAVGAPPERLRLDLAALTFVDAPGLEWLDELIRQGATITACSRFVAAMLDVKSERDRHLQGDRRIDE
jgi:hypothetical protein